MLTAECYGHLPEADPAPTILSQFHDPQGFIPTSSMTSVTFICWFRGVICTT